MERWRGDVRAMTIKMCGHGIVCVCVCVCVHPSMVIRKLYGKAQGSDLSAEIDEMGCGILAARSTSTAATSAYKSAAIGQYRDEECVRVLLIVPHLQLRPVLAARIPLERIVRAS